MELNLSDPVSQMSYVGEKYTRKLQKLGIKTVAELLSHYPSRYDDFSQVKKINELVFGQTVTVGGLVKSVESVYTKRGKNFVRAKLADETGVIDLVWFNQPFLTTVLKEDLLINISGQVGEFSRKLSFVSPDYEILQGQALPVARSGLKETLHTGRLVPVYPETKGLSSKWLRTRIRGLLRSVLIEDPLPEFIRKTSGLTSLKRALIAIHFPKNQYEISQAVKRLAFDELFYTCLRSALLRRNVKTKISNVIIEEEDKTQNYLSTLDKNLPFCLTASQKLAIKEILADMRQKTPMNRLLQGDVGSGKTIVAIMACLAVSQLGRRSFILAPTEILAEQHYNTFVEILKNFGSRIALVTGSKKTGRANADIIIGTHALIYEKSEIVDGGLLVIDEQQKFGVAQRTKIIERLSQNNRCPHLLTLTATPIPRTLALTFLGDLDISILSEKPAGRKKVKTWFVPSQKRLAAYDWIKKQINENQTQAIVVCPLIDPSLSESLASVRSVKEEYQKIKDVFSSFKVELLHGRLKNQDKTRILEGFRRNETQILVATPVVEVGLDIPNLTIIVVEEADRFGMSSLHQFRGRVGRSNADSYCLLFSDTKNPATFSRLTSLEKFDSGLKLAELDLRQRGPGQVFGLLQSGLGYFKLANISNINEVMAVSSLVRKLVGNPNHSQNLEKLIKSSNNPPNEIGLN